MSRHVYTFEKPCNQKHLDMACNVLEEGGIIAYPTDVNWAFGCDATNVKAIEKIRRLKPHHPKTQPFSLICGSISMAASITNIDNIVFQYLKSALPGAYTVLLTSSRELPKQIKDKRKVVGIRIPKSNLLMTLVEQFGKPLATTSVPAIPSYTEELAPPQFGHEVTEAFGHALDLVLDLGDGVEGRETTIIDFTDNVPELVRRGVGDVAIFGCDDA